jgi:crotonobetainyl-CoA:carnitine CoA-transferase CaiB-like acyl-CoA transferase
VRVLDLTQYVAGPYCTQVLADLGAEVLKVEPRGRGDVYRRQGPVFSGGESASFLALNRGKASVEADLALEEDLAMLRDLLAGADVLVESGRPGWLDPYGLGPDGARGLNPRLVYCSISAFGQSGPDAGRGGYDLTVQALTGLMAMTGQPGGPPAKIPVAALDFGSGLYAALGVLAALRQRDATGEGQVVATSLFECALAWLSMHVTTMGLGGPEPEPLGTRSPFFAPYAALRTQDGYVAIVGTGGRDAWGALLRVLGLERLAEDPRFATNPDRVANVDALHEELERVLATAPSARWVEALEREGVTCAAMRTVPEVLASEGARATGLLGVMEHPAAGAFPVVGLPVHLSAAQTTARRPPPRLGENGRGPAWAPREGATAPSR